MSGWRRGASVGVALICAAVALGCRRAHPRVHVVPDVPAFVDHAAAAGIARNAPTYDAAIGDFDGDGRPDLYVGNHGTGAVLLRNLGDGRFADVRAEAGIEAGGDQHGTAWTDYDNDGRLDLVIALGAGRGLGTKVNRLYHNEGGGRFVDRGAVSGVADPHGRSRSLASFDFDRDGWLDLLFVNYASPNRLFRNRHDGTFEDVSDRVGVAAWSGARGTWTDIDGDGYPDLLLSGTPRGPRLLHNEGGERFVDVTEASGLGSMPGTVAGMAFGDFDNDGVLDLYVSIGTDFHDTVNDEGDHVTFAFFAHDAPDGFDFEAADGVTTGIDADLFENGVPVAPERARCGATMPFRSSHMECPLEAASSAGMPDDGTGFFIWHDPAPRVRCPGCALTTEWHLRWRGSGDHHLSGTLRGAAKPVPVALLSSDPRGGRLYRGRPGGGFMPMASSVARHGANGQAVQWADLDGDGWLDLYVVDSGVDGRGGRNVVCMNDGSGGFPQCRADTSASPPSGGGRGSGAHPFDFDGDGRLDIFLTNGWGAPPFDRGPYYLLRNEGAPHHWLVVDLVGTRSNRPGLGAWLTLAACGLRQTRFYTGGPNYFSQSIVPPYFGVGTCDQPAELKVRWPSGVESERHQVALDRVVQVTEGP